jgi:hypothetical protein
MTCRIARSFHRLHDMDLFRCCACGSAKLEVCSTSKIMGPHLCSTCTHSRVERHVELSMAEPEPAGRRIYADLVPDHELQTLR